MKVRMRRGQRNSQDELDHLVAPQPINIRNLTLGIVVMLWDRGINLEVLSERY